MPVINSGPDASGPVIDCGPADSGPIINSGLQIVVILKRVGLLLVGLL